MEINVDPLKQLIEEDLRLTLRCLAEDLGCFDTAVEKKLNPLDKVWKYGVRIPHELSVFQLKQRVDACMDLLSSRRTHHWLHNLITGDEKWVLYFNNKRRRKWLRLIHIEKISYWASGGVSVESFIGKFCQMVLQSLLKSTANNSTELPKNWREARSNFLLMDNCSIFTIFSWLGSNCLSSLSFFISSSTVEEVRRRKSYKICNRWFFYKKFQEFYERGILCLPERWRQVINTDRAYIVEN